MSKPACPMCELTEVLDHPEKWECVTCGQEWERAPEPEATDGPRVVKDAHGNLLTDGDCVVLIKDLKLGGGSQVLKGGSKSKPIRLGGRRSRNLLQDGWHRRRPEGVLREKGLKRQSSR